MAAAYRLKQGVRALLSFTQTPDLALAGRYLSAAQLTLFQRMTRSEQLHSLNVLRTVLAQQPDTPHDLAVAALLHDCGKSRRALTLWHRTLSVLAQKLAPALFDRLSADERCLDWRACFVVRRHHPAWSARLLADAGACDAVVWLAAHHADALADHVQHPWYPLLARLKAADDVN